MQVSYTVVTSSKTPLIVLSSYVTAKQGFSEGETASFPLLEDGREVYVWVCKEHYYADVNSILKDIEKDAGYFEMLKVAEFNAAINHIDISYWLQKSEPVCN